MTNRSDGDICPKCGVARLRQLEVMGRLYRVRCQCRCESEAAHQAELARKAQEMRDRIGRLRSVGIADPALRQATFAADRYGGPEMEKAKRYVNQWERMRTEGIGLLLFGDVGTGKTYLAGCIANALLEQGVSVLMTSFSRILGGMPGSFSGQQNQYIDSFRQFDLLVIDDLGVERDWEYGFEQMFAVIDSRYRAKLPMIITTNLTLSELQSPKVLEKRRIYDRILERCVPILVNGRRIRQSRAQENLETARQLLG